MEKFASLTAVALPLMRENIDTDAIIPSREMKSVSKRGLAEGLFAGWRYTEVGGRELNPTFVLNDAAFEGAKILLGGGNFGCGSSREHAAWALAEYGFRAIIAPSFNPIFRGNCVRNGIVPVEMPADEVRHIAEEVASDPQRCRVTVDLVGCVVTSPQGNQYSFVIEEEARHMLREGLDAIGLTLARAPEIDAFRVRDKALRPWIYAQGDKQ